MTRRVILRPEIPDDLRAIVDYLEIYSTDAANRFVEAAFAAMDNVAAMPGKGSLKNFRIS
jgi:plasmid stabilization system protein ParE